MCEPLEVVFLEKLLARDQRKLEDLQEMTAELMNALDEFPDDEDLLEILETNANMFESISNMTERAKRRLEGLRSVA